MSDWSDDDAVWRDTYAINFDEDRLAAGEDEARRVLELVQFQGGPILDLCCGPGRHAIALAAKGHEVTGVDRTQFLLDKAEAQAAEAGVQVAFVRADMREFVRESSFALVVCMYNSFGYFEDRQQDAVVLRNVCQSLQPGGVFVLECAGKEVLAGVFAAFTDRETPDGTVVYRRRTICDDWDRSRNEIRFELGERTRKVEFTLNLYSGREIKELMLQAGFASVAVYGDLSGAAYDDRATTLIAVGHRAL